MAKNKAAAALNAGSFSLASSNSILETNQAFSNISQKPVDENEIQKIPVSSLVEFSQHPFKVEDDDEFRELRNSIETNGLMVPVILRKADGGKYEIISGHRRVKAVRELGFERIDAIVRDMDNDSASIFMVDCNLIGRKNIRPSEMAFAYKIRKEALSHRSRKEKAEHSSALVDKKIKSRTMDRIISLTRLIPEFLQLLDEKEMNKSSGYLITALSNNEQHILLSYLRDNGIRLSSAFASHIRSRKVSILQEKYPDKNFTSGESLDRYDELDASTISSVYDSLFVMRSSITISKSRLNICFPPDVSIDVINSEIDAFLESMKAKYNR